MNNSDQPISGQTKKGAVVSSAITGIVASGESPWIVIGLVVITTIYLVIQGAIDKGNKVKGVKDESANHSP